MKKDTYFKKMDNIRKKAIEKTATVLAAPKILKSKYIQSRSKNESDIIKKARAYDNAPNFDSKGQVTEAFKARSVAENVKAKIRKRKGGL